MSREITSACCGRFTELQQTCPALQGRKQFIASKSWGGTAGGVRKNTFPWVWEWGKKQTLAWRSGSEGGCCRAGRVCWEQDGVSRSGQALQPPCCRESKKAVQLKHIHTAPRPPYRGESKARRDTKPSSHPSRARHPCAGEKGNFKPQCWPLRLASPFPTGTCVAYYWLKCMAQPSPPPRGSFAMGTAAEPPWIRSYYSSARKPAPCFLFLAAGRPIHISHC